MVELMAEVIKTKHLHLLIIEMMLMHISGEQEPSILPMATVIPVSGKMLVDTEMVFTFTGNVWQFSYVSL